MIRLKRDILTMWLKVIHRNWSWLATEIGVTKGYISQIINNKCKISREFIEAIMLLTNMKFEDIFEMDARADDREFYGSHVYVHGKMMRSADYKKEFSCKNPDSLIR